MWANHGFPNKMIYNSWIFHIELLVCRMVSANSLDLWKKSLATYAGLPSGKLTKNYGKHHFNR